MQGFLYNKINNDINDGSGFRHCGGFAIDDYKTEAKNIYQTDCIIGIVLEDTDTNCEIENFLKAAIDNPMIRIIMIDVHNITEEKCQRIFDLITNFFNEQKVDEYGYMWKDLMSYEDRITYGLLHI